MFAEIKKLVRHSSIYSLGTLSGKIISFLLLPVYTRYLTAREYGILAIINVFVSIFQIFVNLGTQSSVIKVFFEVDKERERKEVISTAFYFLFMVAFISVCGFWFFKRNLASFLLDNPKLAYLFTFALLASFFYVTKTVPLAIFRAQEKALRYSIFAFLTLIFGILFNIIFVIILRENVKGVLKSNLISQFIVFLLILIPFYKDLVLKFNKKYLIRMFTFGLPLVPSGLAMWILTLLDRYFLKVYTTMDIVGIYSIGYRIATIMSMLVIVPFSMAWSPLMLRWYKEEKAQLLYANVYKYFSIAGFFVALMISLFSKEVIHIMTTPPFYGAYTIVYLIVLSYLFHGFYMIFTAGCTFVRKTFFFAIATGTAALSNTALNILLIPHFQMMGAAVATVISYLLMIILMYIFSEKYYHIPFNFANTIKIGIITTMLYIAGVFVTNNIVVSIPVKFLLILCYLPLLYIFKVFTEKEIDILKRMIKKRIQK